ncbi:MAG: hypothetical protein R2745_05460 [Vicinamibacterales bacterium]
MFVPLVWLLALTTIASGQPPAPAQPQAPAAADPARLTFPAGATGLVLVLVKADRTADYEAVLAAVQQSLAAASDDARKMAAGWRVFKAREADAKGNAVYVHWLPSPVEDADYRPSQVLDRLSASLPEELLVKYRDAIAGAPTRLSLDAVADLGLAPVAPKR